MIDLKKLEPYREAGYISTQRHPYLPLRIHNYTQRCQFDRAWDDITLMCRGLITDDHGNVICRPFRKFFNLDEHTAPGSTLPTIDWRYDFYVSEKLDGSLGVLYPTPSGPAIATRGSFVSDQAKVATAILSEKYGRFQPPSQFTFLFEIIYPENRIVVDYGEMRDLFLLDVINNETGYGLPRGAIEMYGRRIGCPVVKHLTDVTRDLLSTYETGEANREGIVVRFDDGTRVKIKLGEYKRLHRLITGLNARKIWECLSTGAAIDLERVPDEFFQWVEDTKAGLLKQYETIEQQAISTFQSCLKAVGPERSRKDYALRFLATREIAPILFKMLDNRPYAELIWKMIYPEHSVPWKGTCDAP